MQEILQYTAIFFLAIYIRVHSNDDLSPKEVYQIVLNFRLIKKICLSLKYD